MEPYWFEIEKVVDENGKYIIFYKNTYDKPRSDCVRLKKETTVFNIEPTPRSITKRILKERYEELTKEEYEALPLYDVIEYLYSRFCIEMEELEKDKIKEIKQISESIRDEVWEKLSDVYDDEEAAKEIIKEGKDELERYLRLPCYKK